MATIKGTRGDDFLRGTRGDDTMDAGRGDDTLMGKAGVDIMTGGKGKDTFVLSVYEFDVIRDFTPGKDKIVLVDDALHAGEDIVRDPARPMTESYFDNVISVHNGVIEYNGAPVVSIGPVSIDYTDLWIN